MELMKLHTILVIAHVMALTLGLGAALIADLTVARRALFRAISRDTVETIEFLGQLVTIGLVLVWITGVVLVAEMTLTGGTILSNPKLWAKVVIVEILTINAVAVHSIVLPTLRAQVGRRLFDGTSTIERIVMGVIGAISLTSWAFPVFLGSARELNHVVPMSGVLAVYGIALAAVVFGAVIVTLSIARKPLVEASETEASRDASASTGMALPDMAIAHFSQPAHFAPVAQYSPAMSVAAASASQPSPLLHNHAPNADLVRALALIAAYEQERTSLTAAAAMRVTAQQIAMQQTAADQRPLPPVMTATVNPAFQTSAPQTQTVADKLNAWQVTLQDFATPHTDLMKPAGPRNMPLFSLPPLPPARPMNTAVLTPRPQAVSPSAFQTPTH